MKATCGAALLIALAAIARAEDPAPKKFDLRVPDRWEAGDVATETSIDDASISIALRREGGAAKENKRGSRIEWRIVRRCLEVSAEGAPTKSHVFVAAWTNTRDDERDETLAGAFIEASREGWTLLTKTTQPSPTARRWLDDRFGPGPRRSDLADFGPTGAVATGESWTPASGSPLEDLVRGRRLPMQLAGVECRATLAAVDAGADGDVVHLTFDAKAALGGEYTTWDGRKMTVDQGGAFNARATADGVPGRWHRGGKAALSADLSTSAKSSDGVLNLVASIKYEHASVAGGEMPAPPPNYGAGAPARFRFAHETTWRAGDAVTETCRVGVVMEETPVGADGKPGATTRKDIATEWTLVRRCVEATPEGAPTRFLVWISEWKAEEGAKPDACLAATLVDVTAKGWTLQNPEVHPTAPAKAWLDRTFGGAAQAGADDGMRGLVTPLSPMAEGETWTPDPLAAAAFLQAWSGFPVDVKGAVASAKLESATGDPAAVQATVAYSIHVPVKCLAGPDCKIDEVLKGGAIDVSGKANGSPATWTQAGTVSDDSKLAASVPEPGGGFRRLSMAQTRKRSRTQGGDIPAK